ncbi:MAG: glycosyltransferase family 4 protein [Acidimicrobiia bacterium]
MKICVCGAQVPFVRGGAELHMENLTAALRDAGHDAELVRLPTAWDRERIFDAALAWRLVPLDTDLVIATNFPSYFARHPNKVVWLFHQHRAAYDAADSAWSDFGLDDDALEAQRRLADWDTRALEEAQHRFTTSGVVADRLARYNGLDATPLYHPPPLFDELRERGANRTGTTGDYVFCATRLDANKRPELLVEAAKHLSSSTRIVIAGKGSMETELRDRIDALGVGDRVELAGFVSDRDLVDLYADALGVVYVPFDEDYGYVTLQAFAAGAPVITAHDSGGTLEWVEDGATGSVTDGSAEEIAAAIDRLATDPAEAARRGAAGHDRVRDLDWVGVVSTLTAP